VDGEVDTVEGLDSAEILADTPRVEQNPLGS